MPLPALHAHVFQGGIDGSIALGTFPPFRYGPRPSLRPVMSRFRRRIAALAAACALAGCKHRPEARYVMRSDDMGVIAMPKDTPENRERAAALMHSHFPDGYEVVCEGEEAVLAPMPNRAAGVTDPEYVHRQRMMADPATMAAWNEPGFQRSVEGLPGTPQSMRGYSPGPMPPAVVIGDPPVRPGGVIRDEWRITYRRKGARSQSADGDQGQSLFPGYQPGSADRVEPVSGP